MLATFTAGKALSALTTSAYTATLQSPVEGDTHLLTVFAGIAAISLLVLVLIVIGILIALVVVGLKARAAVIKSAVEVKGKVYPIIQKTDELVGKLSPTIQSITEKTDSLIGELSPKISGITDNVHGITGNIEHMSAAVKQKLDEFSPTLSAMNQTALKANDTVREANFKTHEQVERVNGMVTAVLDKAVGLSEALGQAAQVPVKGVARFATNAKGKLDAILSKIHLRPKS